MAMIPEAEPGAVWLRRTFLAECARPRAQQRPNHQRPGESDVQGLFDLAAPEDGRTPLYRYTPAWSRFLAVTLAGWPA